MRSRLLFMLLVSLPISVWAKSGTSVYTCAHPDDCILFMNPNLYNDIAYEADKVVVIYLTSGDAGRSFSSKAGNTSYAYVREQASIDATEWMADVGHRPLNADEEVETVTIQDHPVQRVSYGNTVSYFLRLPDGNFTGEGFGLYNHESLQRLKIGEIDKITPIDNTAAYNGWPDLVSVLSSILKSEIKSEKNVTLHVQDPNTQANTKDHSDHTTGATGILEAAAKNLNEDRRNRCYTIYKHIDYSIAQKPTNLEGAALQNKSGSFAVLTATQRHSLDHYSWDEGHLAYIPRNYYTTVTLPENCKK